MPLKHGQPITMEDLWWSLPPDHPSIPAHIKVTRQLNDQSAQGESTSPYVDPSHKKRELWASGLSELLTKHGVSSTAELPADVRSQMPNQGLWVSNSPKTFGGQLVDFVTSPAFLTLAGGVAGVYGAGAGAAGAAAEGGTAAGTAATGEALGSGITATAAEGGLGAGLGTTTAGTGLSGAFGGGSGTAAGLGGAGGTGLTTTGALGAGSSLAPGYFASEGIAGGASGASGAPATGGGSSLAPQDLSLTELAMKGAPVLLGAYASDKQSDAYSGLAGQYMAMGEPYRQRLSDLYNDPSSFLNSPEVQVPIQQGTNILARSLSTQGNPAGSGNALQELQNYATNQMYSKLGQERDRLGGFGGLTAYNQAAPQMSLNAINAKRGVYDAIGGGMADIFGNQGTNWEEILKSYYA